ncbi:STAS domain-containing protein [Amycolatopsis sp. 195334CR]|uniref:STAS domain-containing protein n=1 Tax=Amycolatopsis sp. 195334CR TaxID=2814588 RepID=UPI001A8F0D14|nr:STAS domain-containing protein [Amycolatopsis sp. 195334CR]MBN6040656.1 STAS domain-containing protein [Amycolatopsis sp. 195334CR]
MTLAFRRDKLTIQAEHTDQANTVVVSGEVDLATKTQFDTELTAALEPPAPVLVVDLSGVDFLSSCGLQVLLELAERAERRACDLRIVCAGRPVRRPIEIVGLDRTLRLFGSREEALAAQLI